MQKPLDTSIKPSNRRVMAGVFFNLAILVIPTIALSSVLMQAASNVLGEKVAWPQIAFMSAYPSDVRNGYLLFVAALFSLVFVSSGLFAGLVGASPGKAALQIRYVCTANHRKAGFARMILRATILILLLIPMFVVGPVLGFVFGEAADPLSLTSLCFGIAIVISAFTPWRDNRTWLDRVSGVEPTLRPFADEKPSRKPTDNLR